MTSSQAPIPLACNTNAIEPDQREKHGQVTVELSQKIRAVSELANGYAFQFLNETPTLFKIAKFVSNERLCCPFLRFNLEVGAGNDPLRLSLTGPENIKEFLQAEFEDALKSRP